MTKKEVKKKIEGLIEKYEKLTLAQRKDYNEATTRKDFIMPLFEALGWDVYNISTSNEVVEEEAAIEGIVDYSFRLYNIPQFLLEAKALKTDLNKIEWAKQAVNYGWNMGIKWVILTDFESLKLFNSDWKVDTPRPNLEITHKQYLNRLDDLMLLSKKSFKNNVLDKQTEKWGIKAKRIEIDGRLAKDLIEWREHLFNNFSKWNPEIQEQEIDEAVQKILDRFIFIRSCEDRKIEPPILWQSFQKWNKNIGKEYNFLKVLKPVFKNFDMKYNSNLFIPHFCEELNTEGAPFGKIVNGLYGNIESGVKYNFAAIKPDVLGKVYEQYLGHISEKEKKKETGYKKIKRKKQGIYYTPIFIVDYIIQNSISKILGSKSLKEINDLKVLDPACGSGSFLIKAFDILNEEISQRENLKKPADKANRKYRILINNIYGVDIDEQAIEISRLNLLLKAVEPSHKLPLLSDNIKIGNSLISGTEKEFKKWFGKNWKKKKPFNWRKKF